MAARMTQPRCVVRRGGLAESLYLQPDGTAGAYSSAKRFRTQDAADAAGAAAFGDNYGIFPVSRPRQLKESGQ